MHATKQDFWFSSAWRYVVARSMQELVLALHTARRRALLHRYTHTLEFGVNTAISLHLSQRGSSQVTSLPHCPPSAQGLTVSH